VRVNGTERRARVVVDAAGFCRAARAHRRDGSGVIDWTRTPHLRGDAVCS
jgi:hypothetical protein